MLSIILWILLAIVTLFFVAVCCLVFNEHLIWRIKIRNLELAQKADNGKLWEFDPRLRHQN